VLAPAAAARAQLSMEVSPLRVELKAGPGGTTTQAVTLTNTGKDPVRVRAQLSDWHLARDGAPQFVEATDARYSATSWVRVAPPEQVIEPNRGATVRSHDAEDLDDLYQLRALLEGYAARRAASRLSDEALVELDASCERFAALVPEGDLRDIVRENALFHGAILDAAGSQRLAGMVRKVIELPLVYRSYIWYSPDQFRVSAHYHRQIANALAARDAERAELIMKEHVFEARDLLVAHLRGDGAGT
jgi:hypothetical protein